MKRIYLNSSIFLGNFFYSAFFIQFHYLPYLFLSGSITMGKFIDVASRICSGLMWFLILMCLSWPFAFPAALLYVLTLPFAGRSEITREISIHLLRFVQLPLRCANNMFAMAPLCNSEFDG